MESGSYSGCFVPHLQMVRAYSHVSAASSKLGDEVLGSALRQISGTGVAPVPGRDALLALLREVHVANELTESLERDIPTSKGTSKLNPFNLPNPIRQFMFLHHVVGLSDQEVAFVTAVDAYSVRAFLAGVEEVGLSPTKPRVLVVEDDVWIANHLADIIDSLGNDVIGIAKNARLAAKVADRTRPDLLICDVDLGKGTDGINLAIQLQADGKIPCIFVTAFPEKVKKLHPISCAGILAKPFDEGQLRVHMTRALQNQAYAS